MPVLSNLLSNVAVDKVDRQRPWSNDFIAVMILWVLSLENPETRADGIYILCRVNRYRGRKINRAPRYDLGGLVCSLTKGRRCYTLNPKVLNPNPKN